ncbi:MAG: DUF4976 domain-containing protein [Prosthecobacter sp.]|nr:DUF4976 domain-containing protein [Prosthecobacter sp.]
MKILPFILSALFPPLTASAATLTHGPLVGRPQPDSMRIWVRTSEPCAFRIRTGLAAQVDIYPTLCDLAGLPKPKHLQGRSLKPMLDDPNAKGREIAISTMIATHTKALGHSLRTEAFRYIVWDEGRGGELLYDLRTDPDELHNLAARPMQAERLTRMRNRLAAHLKAIANP